MVEWTVIICMGGVRSITKFMLTYSLLFQNNYNYMQAWLLGARLDKNST